MLSNSDNGKEMTVGLFCQGCFPSWQSAVFILQLTARGERFQTLPGSETEALASAFSFLKNIMSAAPTVQQRPVCSVLHHRQAVCLQAARTG